jgi:hypothetical protein
VVIKASSSAEIRTLVDALEQGDELHREAAVARLAVIGSRAVERLIEAYGKTTERLSRVTILRALEAIGDHRAGALARQAIHESGDVAVAATGVLRALLTASRTASATEALDALVAVALDRTHAKNVRLAALDALQDMPDDVRARVAEALRADPDAGFHEISRPAADVAVWNEAMEGHLPEDAGALRGLLATRASGAPLNALRKMIDAVRAKEREVPAARRDGWLALRGSLHQALALRGSRVALYDLRETLENETDVHRLPVSFLAALHVLGDRTCLEPLAAAWGRTAASEEHIRYQLASALKAIAKREKITRGHTLMKRIVARWPGIVSTP